jgi:transcriptional regulator with XRE-family HTH domain
MDNVKQKIPSFKKKCRKKNMSDFHTRLNESISRSGLTQDEISARSGVSTKTIQNWTRAAAPTMPRMDQGVMVAMVLGTSAEYLVTGKMPAGISEGSFKIAMAAERLDGTGKVEALHLVQSLEALHPLAKPGASSQAGA